MKKRKAKRDKGISRGFENQKSVNLRKTALDFKIFGRQYIDPKALDQMYTAMKMPVVVKGALMADAHVGYGLPIGGVVAAYNAVMPYGVGMDIGCRMCLSVFDHSPEIIDKQRDRLKNILIENTRFGLAEFKDLGDHELMERKEFKEIKFLKSLQKNFYKQLGTSGHGNHFVEFGIVVIEKEHETWNLGDPPECSGGSPGTWSRALGMKPGTYFSVLSHSGSRNFGAEIAKHYTRIAKEKLGLFGETANLSWLELDSEEGQEYWQAMTLAGDYSKANHRIIHQKLSKALGLQAVTMVENHHNYAWQEKISEHETLVIHRKGAIPAGIGDTGVIPGNMVDAAYIVAGKGNDASMHSASHGAGRVMSRRQAKKSLTASHLNKVLEKSGVELIGGGMDEAPSVYKNIHQVMEAQKELVTPIGKFYPKIVRME